MAKGKGLGLALGVAGLVVGAAALGWWVGSSWPDRGAGPAAVDHVEAPAGAVGGAVTEAVPMAGDSPPAADAPFKPLHCQARQFNGTLALAVTFGQPVSRSADLLRWMSVRDAGELDGDKRDPDQPARAVAAKTGEWPARLRDASKPVNGSWTVAEDARTVYFPYVKTQRRYLVRFAAGVPGATQGVETAELAHCDIDTDVMPSAFYFASRGVVLPAGQNGGLPVATVNVAEVDVQFLRVDPAQIPQFFDAVLGVGASPSSEASDSDDEADEYDAEDGDWRHADNRTLQGLVGLWDLDRLRRVSTSVFQGRFVTPGAPDRRNVTFLPVEDIDALRAPGIYVAIMSQPGRFSYESQVTYFYVSDIGLHARRYTDTVEAFAVSLTSGRPQHDVEVALVDANGRALKRARADAQGRVSFADVPAEARLLRAMRGSEMTVLALGEPALDLSEFDVAGLAPSQRKLFAYAGRNLYRPGETFTVSVLARDPDGRTPQQLAPLTATLKRADGRTVSTTLWTPHAQAPGYSEHDLTLPADAQTGSWRLELRADPAQRHADAVWPFQVEEFLPERMKLLLAGPDTPPMPGQTMAVTVQGDYLYGAPAAGNRLLASVQTQRAREALPQAWPGFVFGDVDDDDRRSQQTLDDRELDGRGHATLEVEPDIAQARSPMRVRLSASLLESGGRPVVRSLEQIWWPASTLLAVRPQFDRDVAPQGKPAGFELIRVDRDGAFQPLAKADWRLYKEQRTYYWRYDDQRGWNSGYTESDTLVEQRSLALTERSTFTVPVDWGRYRLEISDPQTGEVLRYRFYAGWDAQDAETLGNRPDRVQMKLGGVPVEPGAPLSLTVTPPHDGQALVSVEGGGLLWSKWVDVRATGTEISIPTDASWRRHDLYVSAVVFRPGSQGDRVTPARAVGLAYIPVQSAHRRLDVSLQAPANVRPETTVQAQVQVQGGAPAESGQARQAFVTVSAVDVGILNINQYKTPDPFAFFFGKHRYGPELLDMYGKLIEKMAGRKGRLRWGGDADQRGDSRSLPKKVKLVDVFSGLVALDEQGRANVPLAIPDFNGSLRLMAVAFDAAHYGHAERELTVAAPVVAELNTPRFMTPRDEAAIALDVTNLSGGPRRIAIQVHAGAPLNIPQGLRTVELADKQRTILRFAATGTPGQYGAARIDVDILAEPLDGAEGETYRARRESILQVQPAYAPTRRTEQVRLVPGEAYELPEAWTERLMPTTVTRSMAISSRLPFDVPKLVKDLLTYPYGCTEQTISAVMPWLVLSDEDARAYALKGDFAGQRDKRVAGAISRLSGMRNAQGAYSLWGSGSGARDVWLTAYAYGFLVDAEAAGHAVRDEDIARTRDWLISQLQRAPDGFGQWSASLRRGMQEGRVDRSSASVLRDDHRRFAALAAASEALAREQRAPLASVRTLFDRYAERSRSPLPLAQLAVAFKRMGDAPRAQQAAALAMARGYGLPSAGGSGDEWLGDYGSATRDLALTYHLLMSHDLEAGRRETLLPLLAQRLRGRQYFSTQEQLALILAARAGQAKAAGWRAEVVAGAARQLAGEDTQLHALPPGTGPARVVNTGEVPIFVNIDIQGTDRAAPPANQRTATIERTWYRPDGARWNGGSLRTGDILVVHLRANARTAMPDALVVDQVPAGLEVENLNLSQGPDMADWRIAGKVVAQAMQDGRVLHTEFRDDRFVAAVSLGQGDVDVFYRLRVVTPGRYVVPAAVVEAMYRPELRAIGEGWGDIEVRDRAVGGP